VGNGQTFGVEKDRNYYLNANTEAADIKLLAALLCFFILLLTQSLTTRMYVMSDLLKNLLPLKAPCR
jgi:hypothetical protein